MSLYFILQDRICLWSLLGPQGKAHSTIYDNS